MYEVDFTLSGWAGAETHTVRGETASDLLWEIGTYQDLYCLVRMGKQYEDADGKKEVRKIERLLKKEENGTLTIKDLSGFEANLSVGKFQIYTVREIADE